MSRYDKAHEVREQEGMRIQSECNVRNKLNLRAWDQIPHMRASAEYSKLLKAEIDKHKCKKPRKHI